MTMGLWLDALVSVFLVGTIASCIVLNRRLGRLRAGRAEFEAMIAEFVQATVRAERSIAKLKSHAGREHSALEADVETARTLRDELDFLVERADGEARKLERLIGAARPDGSGEEVLAPADGADAHSSGKTEAERELLKTMEGLR
ncbi:MAG: DUF6468 domain-containing protein [Alphaproteobacteria bacterium]